MNRLSSATWIQLNPWRTKLGLPWAVPGIVFLTNLIPVVMAGREDVAVGSHAGVWALTIYLLIVSAVKPRDNFPITMGLSGTRKVFYAAAATTIVIESVAYAVVLYLLSVLERATNSWGVGLHLFDVPFLGHLNPVTYVLACTAGLLALGFLGLFCGLISTRWGKTGLFTAGILAGGVLGGAFALISLTGQWETIGQWFAGQPEPVLYPGWPLLITAVLAVAGWFVIRRARA